MKSRAPSGRVARLPGDGEALNALLARLMRDDPLPAAHEVDRADGWEVVCSFAWQNRLGSMLLAHLNAHGIELPPSARHQLEAHAEHVAAVNAYNRKRLRPVLQILNDVKVPFLLLKGAALNAVLYTDASLRPMVDIDLMIHPADVERADTALRDAGCRPGEDLLRGDFYPRYHYEREYLSGDTPRVRLDVHVRPFRPLRYARTVPDDALWDRPDVVRVDGVNVRIPNPSRMLIHLLVHAACHGLREVRWLYDIKSYLAAKMDRISIAQVADLVTRWKLNLPAEQALARVIDAFALENPRVLALQRALRGRVNLFDRLALNQAPRDQDRPVMDVLVNALCTPGFATRLGYLRAVCLPEKSHLAQVYPYRHPGWPLAAQTVRLTRRIATCFHASPDAPG